MGSTQQATFPVTEARIFQPRRLRSKKASQNQLLFLRSSFWRRCLGLGLGFEGCDRSVFRTARQLETELRIPCVALVPEINTKNIKQPWHQKILSHAGTNGKESANDVFTSVINPLYRLSLKQFALSS